jgi:ribosomal protein S18 acetylase RimI-like enzyme
MSIRVRHAVESDADAVANLSAEFEVYLRTLGDTTDCHFTAETFRRDGFGDEPAIRGLVAQNDAEIVGYILYTFGYDTDQACRTLNIEDLYVSEQCRKRGVGKALMEMAQDVCRAIGGKEICWSVLKVNTPAYDFYTKLGAKLIDDEDFMYLAID